MPKQHIDVLGGYVRHLWTAPPQQADLESVNDARASMHKHTDVMRPQDERLVHYLSTHIETGPIRGAYIKFEIKAPVIVLNHLHRYTVAAVRQEESFSWSEASGRYIPPDEYYVPPTWFSKPSGSIKQGQGDPLSDALQSVWTDRLRAYQEEGDRLYGEAIRDGMAPQQARLLTAYAGRFSYVRFSWGLQTALHILDERLGQDAQWETNRYAQAIAEIVQAEFPIAAREFLENSPRKRIARLEDEVARLKAELARSTTHPTS